MEWLNSRVVGNVQIGMVAILFLLLGISTYATFVGSSVLFQSPLTGSEVVIHVPDSTMAAKEFKRSIERGLNITCRDQAEYDAVVQLMMERRKAEMQAAGK